VIVMNDRLRRASKRLGEVRLLSRLYHEARLRRTRTSGARPILIYQMGKVGSRSVVDALRAMKLGRPVYHVHFLNRANLDRAERRLREAYGRRYNVNRWCLYESRFVLRHFIDRPAPGLTIISLVRDPVARNLSSFFQNVDRFIPNCAALYEAGRIGAAEITRAYLHGFHEHALPLTWFDEEMKAVFGIDVFAGDAVRSHNDRVFAYRRGGLDLLVLRTEDLDDVAPAALPEFLRIDTFTPRRANAASEKRYHRVYADVAEGLRLPETYLDAMYGSQYARFFYTAAEVERFRARWARG
jgi:hypothetical protein